MAGLNQEQISILSLITEKPETGLVGMACNTMLHSRDSPGYLSPIFNKGNQTNVTIV